MLTETPPSRLGEEGGEGMAGASLLQLYYSRLRSLPFLPFMFPQHQYSAYLAHLAARARSAPLNLSSRTDPSSPPGSSRRSTSGSPPRKACRTDSPGSSLSSVADEGSGPVDGEEKELVRRRQEVNTPTLYRVGEGDAPDDGSLPPEKLQLAAVGYRTHSADSRSGLLRAGRVSADD